MSAATDLDLHHEMGVFETTFETASDLIKEREAGEIIRKRMGWDRLVKLPPKSPIDFAAELDALIVGYVEVKCRRIKFRQYSDFAISAQKYVDLIKQMESTGRPSYIILATVDGVFLHLVRRADNFKQYIGGRTDRGNPNDVEAMIGIPWEEFT